MYCPSSPRLPAPLAALDAPQSEVLARTVLVVEDDDAQRESLRRALEGAGYLVAEARDGREGLAAFGRLAPDLVLCDLFMPELDGLGFLRQLRRRGGARVVAMLGGGACVRGDFAAVALALGAAVALEKPFGPDEMLSAVREALGGGGGASQRSA